MFLKYKPVGITLNEQINELKKVENCNKICYAGRLDPMAHGLMIYLKNEECKSVQSYLGLDKTYRFKIICGISTDTYDILGKINSYSDKFIDTDKLDNNINIFIGEYNQEYPPFSSKVVNDKPLWKHALDNTLNNIKIPKKKINIYNLKIISKTKINFRNLQENVIYKINLLKSDNFRKDEIIKDWESLNLSELSILEMEADVSSGTYIRSLSQRIGNYFNCPTVIYDIFRTRIGNFNL